MRVIGREQTVGDTGLFESINVLGEPNVAAPVRMELTQRGRTQAFTGNEAALR